MAQEAGTSVAWFKLAELVSRGEKEKALNLYRLLSHSFDVKAYALQVEGDILWAFEDSVAIEKYEEAARLYQKEKQIAPAAAVYEHLVALRPDNYVFMKSLALCYARLGWEKKLNNHFAVLCDLAKRTGVSQDDLQALVGEIGEVFQDFSAFSQDVV